MCTLASRRVCASLVHGRTSMMSHFSSWQNVRFQQIFEVTLRPSWEVCAASSYQAAQTHHPVNRSDLSTQMDPCLPPVSHPMSEARQSASPRHYLPLASHRHRQRLPFHQRSPSAPLILHCALWPLGLTVLGRLTCKPSLGSPAGSPPPLGHYRRSAPSHCSAHGH